MSSVWSVRGVSPALRRRVVQRAGEAGLSVAEWLERALAPALEGRDAEPRATTSPPADLLWAIAHSLGTIDALTAEATAESACGPASGQAASNPDHTGV